MSDERVDGRVKEILASGLSPEAVCQDDPELLAAVRTRLAAVRAVEGTLDAIFPHALGTSRASRDIAELPSVPGYEVECLLGRGGMGVVFRARQRALSRHVALKMMLVGSYATQADLGRFLREAETIAKVSHPNIVAVYDAGESEGRLFFAMELVEGGTLADKLGGRPQPIRASVELAEVLASAIHAAHEAGIVHRDLKPANVLLTPDGTPKIADFGLAKRVAPAETLTGSGMALGTPSYMAPEQVRGSPVELAAAVDVYALGAILYEMLTGKPPFRSETPVATQMQVLTEDPLPPSRLNSSVPRDVETICLRCLHKSPARRYPSAAELAADLRRFLNHEPIRARPVGRMERGFLWSRRNPAKVTAMSFALVLLGYSIDRIVERQTRARETREQEAVLAPQLDGVFDQLRNGELAQARSTLDRMPETVSEELRERMGRARRELLFVEQLEGIRLRRVEITEGRFDRSANRKAADQAYDDAFRTAGFGAIGDDPGVIASRVRDAAVRSALVGALDDWAFCAGDEAREAWLLDVARQSDHDPSSWRERLRDPALRLDATTLGELAEDVRANRMTVQLLLGAAERMREAKVDVIPLLRVVQEANPGDFWANFALGDVLWWRDPEEAIRYAQAAVALRPRSSVAHQALGTALRKAKRLEDALREYRQAVLVEPGFAETHGRLALTLQDAKMVDEAIAEYREAIRINPDLAWVHLNLGVLLDGKKLSRDALDEFRAAARLDPRSGIANRTLGASLESFGRDREAVVSFQRAADVEPIAVSLNMLGSCLARLGRFEEAEAQFRRAIELEPADTTARHAQRMILVQLGRAEDALASFRAAIQASPADSLAWDGYLELCAYLGRQDDYRRACVELLERFGDTDDPRACERIGRACLLMPSESTMPTVVVLIDRAVASPRSPEWTRPYVGVAQALAEYRRSRFASAIEILEGDAGAVLPPLPDLIRAMALQRTGAEAEARHNLATAELSVDWSPSAAGSHDSWIRDVIRREAEVLVVPELENLLNEREQPRDQDTRAVMVGALVSTHRDAAASRLYEQLSNEVHPGMDRGQRYLAARVLSRAGAGLGVDPANDPERARFRERVREWLRVDLASCRDLLTNGETDGHSTALAILHSWLNDPAFAPMRDDEAMEQLPLGERNECRGLWLEVESLVQSNE